MKYKHITILLVILTIFSLNCKGVKNSNRHDNSIQANLDSEFNFHCENHTYGDLPDGWWKWGSTENYSMKKDTTEYVDGKSSIKLNLNDNSNKLSFAAATYRIPAIYSGKELTLTGYIRTKDITEGNAYITTFMRNSDELVKNETKSTIVSGTTEWKKYSLTVPYRTDAQWIYIAGKLYGNGSAWFDKFEIKIDNIVVK